MLDVDLVGEDASDVIEAGILMDTERRLSTGQAEEEGSDEKHRLGVEKSAKNVLAPGSKTTHCNDK